ncbi:MAG: hypothetical protein JWM59_2445 [Verrucomicrobiales bacterium]|nr:hypothetical protein [Verrucomicrobiales bacterium]
MSLSLLAPPAGTVPAMSSVDIAVLTNKEHYNVLRDIKNTLEEAGIGALKFEGTYTDSQNKERPCYHLPKFELDLVVSGYSVKYRATIIKRWHELEAEKAAPKFDLPATMAEALRLAADTMDQLEAAKVELADAAPKLLTYDRCMNGDGLFNFREVASHFPEKGIGGNNLVKILIEERILYRDAKGHVLAFRPYIERGYFKGVESPYELKSTGESRVSVQIKVTPAGVEFIARKLTERERRTA